MRRLGSIQQWNDDKGFGFVSDDVSGDRVFVHISAFPSGSRRPAVGSSISYVLTRDRQARPRAARAQFADSKNSVTSFSERTRTLLLVGAITVVALAALALVARRHGMINLLLGWYAVTSTLSFINYAIDKVAARRNTWRTPEKTLHMFDLAGGWPGGLLAQQLLRHKSSKRSFQSVFWVTVVLNCLAAYWLLTPDGRELVQHALRNM